ncbi:MAG TPA: YbbR-like domain-containing protein [Longimicrobiales bacterium]
MGALSRWLPRNWGLKFAALGLAIFLWAVVQADPDSTNTVLSVPVLVQVDNPEWTPLGPPTPAEVEVHLSGSLRDITRITRGGTVVRIPIADVTARDTVVELRRDWVITDGGGSLVVQQIIPGSVILTFEQTLRRPVPLSVRTIGELPEDVALVQPMSASPAVVNVTGPASRVEALDYIALRPLDLTELRESGAYPVGIDTTGLHGLFLRSVTASVGVTLEGVIEQLVPAVPVVLAEFPPGADSTLVVVEPRFIPVTLLGARTRVSQTAIPLLRAVVDAEALDGLRPGQQRTVPFRLEGVPELVRARPDPDSVRVMWLTPPETTDQASSEPAAPPGEGP